MSAKVPEWRKRRIRAGIQAGVTAGIEAGIEAGIYTLSRLHSKSSTFDLLSASASHPNKRTG